MIPFSILLFAFLLKIPFLAKPLVGYFGSYQTINAMMAQMMLHGPWQNLTAPRTFILFDGHPGLHLIYYPIGSLAAAVLNSFFSGSLVFWGRFQAALFALLAGVFFFKSTEKILNRRIALISLFIFSLSPTVMTMGTSFQNEAPALFFLSFAFWLFLSEKIYAGFLAGLLFAFAVAARLHFLSVAPVFLFVWGSEKRKGRQLLVFILGLLIPIFLLYGYYYLLEKNFPTQVMTSLFSQSHEGRLLPDFLGFTKDFYSRLLMIMIGPWLTPVILPLLLLQNPARWKKERIFGIWLVFSLSVIVLLPKKVADHPFYLIHCVPAAAVLAASAYETFKGLIRKSIRVLFWSAFLFCALRYYVPTALSGGMDKKKIPAIGKQVQALTQPQDKIIASHGSSPDLLYYANRWGWPFSLTMRESYVLTSPQPRHQRLVGKGYGDPVLWLEKLRSEGAAYLVLTEPDVFRAQKDFFDHVMKNYPLVQKSDRSFLLFDLREKRT